MLDFEFSRARMIKNQLSRRGITDPGVLAAMGKVRRESFVAPDLAEFAYEDAPLTIGFGQTISQPFIVAAMIQHARIGPEDKVLEVGTGSGYAAAVLAELVREVHTVERNRRLGEAARERLSQLGYDNVSVHIVDGTGGWPEAAPFDAIIVAASAPSIPEPLKEQLELGGRLIIPIGSEDRQHLIRIVRTSATTFSQDDLGRVMFVPLIGRHGWNENSTQHARALSLLVANSATALPALDDPLFGTMFDRLAEHRIVLLGESTHGTSEFYRARAAVTKRLVEAHGFRIVAIEADWPDAAIVDRFVCDRPHPQKEPVAFQRFPRWMWRNRETSELLTWLKGFNIGRAEADRCRFRGLDIYNMHGAIDAVITYLEKIDPRAAAVARERYGCLTPWQNEPSTYGRAVLTKAYKACEDAVIQQCRDLLARRLDYESADVGAFFDAQQNARLVAAAEHYYRIMYYGNASAWNLRDRQMFDTLERLLGAKEKAVVWAHNSHVADARHTEMGASRDELSLGQLCREGHGAECAIVGFGSYEGTVTAAHDWNRPSETMSVAPAHSASYERIFHDAGVSPALFDFIADEALKSELSTSRLQRFIGVVYRRETELRSHYMEVALPLAFDAFVWFDRSEAITPIDGDGVRRGAPDTFPFGL